MENPIKMDDLGVRLFVETPMSKQCWKSHILLVKGWLKLFPSHGTLNRFLRQRCLVVVAPQLDQLRIVAKLSKAVHLPCKYMQVTIRLMQIVPRCMGYEDMNEHLHKLSTGLWYLRSSFLFPMFCFEGSEGSDGHHSFELENLWGEPKGKIAATFEGVH